ncbi:MAG: helix-turn-helix transcriptional regulator [Vulcanimicrobiota bacterium]
MSNLQDDDQFQAEFRAKLYSSQVDSGLSLPQLADKLGLQPTSLLGDYFKGKLEMPVSLLHRYARLVSRPIWWFFGEQPQTISIEAAQNAMTNVSRARVYLDAVESEFRSVLKGNRALYSMEDTVTPAPIGKSAGPGPVVVDFAPYLARARALLEAEAECTEDSEEVFEESVEMIAHRLYSLEMATSASREMMPVSSSTGSE